MEEERGKRCQKWARKRRLKSTYAVSLGEHQVLYHGETRVQSLHQVKISERTTVQTSSLIDGM